MAKKVQSIEQPTQDISNSKIEAIKNLIFGENIQEYNHEFDTLKAELERRQRTCLAKS